MTLAKAKRPGYDSTNVRDLPAATKIAGAYADGTVGSACRPSAVRKRFPKALVVSITVNPNSGAKARCIDIERGDYTTATAITKTHELLARGVRPVMHYLSASPWPAHRKAVKKAGLVDSGPDPDVVYWIADYDNDPMIPAGAVGKQYADPVQSGHHYDVTAWVDHIPGVDPKPKPPTATDFSAAHNKTLIAAAEIMEARAKSKTPLTTAAKKGIVTRLRVDSGDLLL